MGDLSPGRAMLRKQPKRGAGSYRISSGKCRTSESGRMARHDDRVMSIGHPTMRLEDISTQKVASRTIRENDSTARKGQINQKLISCIVYIGNRN